MKAKFNGKVVLMIDGVAYTPGDICEVSDVVMKDFAVFFEEIVAPKAEPKAESKPKTK